MLKELHAAHILPVRILNPPGQDIVSAEVVHVLEVHASDNHQTGADGRTTLVRASGHADPSQLLQPVSLRDGINQ